MNEKSRNLLQVFPEGTKVVGHMSGGAFELEHDQTLPILTEFRVPGMNQRGITAYLSRRTGEQYSGQLVTCYLKEE